MEVLSCEHVMTFITASFISIVYNDSLWHSQRQIAQKNQQIKVCSYIKNKNKTPQKIPGRPEKLNPRNKQAIIRDVRKSGKSVSQIQLPGDKCFMLNHMENIKKLIYNAGQSISITFLSQKKKKKKKKKKMLLNALTHELGHCLLGKSPRFPAIRKKYSKKKCSVNMSMYCFESTLPLTRTNLNIPLEQNAPMSLQSHLHFGIL